MAFGQTGMRILVIQETDWIDRNPILHHRMLESLALEGDEIVVVDFDILWHTKHRRPIIQRRAVLDDCHKFFPSAHIRVVRPATARVAGLARPSWLVANVPELHRLMKDFDPQVVVAYSISNAFVALKMAQRRGVPFVYHVLDALHTLAEPAWLRPVARPVERSILQQADEVIVVNNGLRDYAIGMGVHPQHLHVIPMGVERQAPDAIDPEAVRSKLGFSPDDVVLLFMGWLYRFSGLPELLDQLAAHRATAPWLKLLVVGDGDIYDELHQKIGALNLADTVVMTGRRAFVEMREYIAAADFGLLSAQPIETMEHIVPAKVIEYMEGATAVVSTRLRGMEAEFGHLPGIVYVDGPGDVVQKLEALLELVSDRRGMARELGRSCAEFMASRPSWDDVTAEFRDVVHGARPRSEGTDGTASLRRWSARR